jgi:hypothetical protein
VARPGTYRLRTTAQRHGVGSRGLGANPRIQHMRYLLSCQLAGAMRNRKQFVLRGSTQPSASSEGVLCANPARARTSDLGRRSHLGGRSCSARQVTAPPRCGSVGLLDERRHSMRAMSVTPSPAASKRPYRTRPGRNGVCSLRRMTGGTTGRSGPPPRAAASAPKTADGKYGKGTRWSV